MGDDMGILRVHSGDGNMGILHVHIGGGGDGDTDILHVHMDDSRMDIRHNDVNPSRIVYPFLLPSLYHFTIVYVSIAYAG